MTASWMSYLGTILCGTRGFRSETHRMRKCTSQRFTWRLFKILKFLVDELVMNLEKVKWISIIQREKSLYYFQVCIMGAQLRHNLAIVNNCIRKDNSRAIA